MVHCLRASYLSMFILSMFMLFARDFFLFPAFYFYGSLQSSWQQITPERYSKAFQLFWMWQARMLEMVEVMEWKTSWEYDSGLVITTWKAVIKKEKKKHARSQHTVLSLEKLLEGRLANKHQVLEWSLFSAKSFLKEETFPSQTWHLEPVVRMRSKCASNSLCLTFFEVMQTIAGDEGTSNNPNYVG